MNGMRPEVSLTAVARLLLVVGLAGLCLSSSWFEIRSRGTFTEGLEREPTLWANYTIDGSEEVIELEISNATPLISYWADRESVAQPSNASSEPAPSDAKEPEETFWTLSNTRLFVKSVITLCCLFELLCVIKPHGFARGMAVALWMLGLIALTVLIPLSVILPTAGGDDGEASQPGDGFETGEEGEEGQFAHSKFESRSSVRLDAIEWSFDSSGYDLGLVSEAHRDAVRESPPEEGEEGADAFIRFAGEIRMVISTGVWVWFSVPIMWTLVTIIGALANRLKALQSEAEAASSPLR